MGDSIGKWEGDTLVADTVSFNDKTTLDREGYPHSDALHLVERIRRVDHDSLVIDLTVDDPKAYTKPWGAKLIFQLRPDWKTVSSISITRQPRKASRPAVPLKMKPDRRACAIVVIQCAAILSFSIDEQTVARARRAARALRKSVNQLIHDYLGLESKQRSNCDSGILNTPREID